MSCASRASDDLHGTLVRLNRVLEEASQNPVLDAGDLNAAMVHIVDAISEGLVATRVGIWQLHSEEGVLSCLLVRDQALGLCWDSVDLVERQCPTYVQTIRRSRVIVAHDAGFEPAMAELGTAYIDAHDIRSKLDAPIRRGGHVVGIVSVEQQGSARTWSIAETTFVGVMADRVARAISGHQRLQARKELEAINVALEDRVLSRTRELQDAMDRLQCAQEQLVESEKFAALGSLVAGVAHEVNTPVGVAVTALSHLADQVDILRGAYQDESLSRSALETFLSEADRSCSLLEQNLRRAANLVRSFKRVAVNQSNELHACFHVREELRNVLVSLQLETRRRGVKVALCCDESLTMCSFPGPVAQLVANLVMNSLLHGYEGRESGLIRIGARLDDDRIVFTYDDDGCGIPRQDLRRVFEPFFTTRRKDGGTGLGLHIVYNLVNHKLGGTLELASDDGRGVHYRIVLPQSVPAEVSHVA